MASTSIAARPLNRAFVLALLGIFLAGMGCAAVRAVPLSADPQKDTLDWGGLARTYTYYVPASLKGPHAHAPLVLVLHGGLGTGAGMEKLTFNRFNQLADQDGFLVAYPDGVGKNWNDGRHLNDPAHKDKIDDVGFISALIDRFEKRYGADPRRVYVTGISNGAMMCCRLACGLSGKIAAAAPVAGSLPEVLAGSCRPEHPVSMMFINGDKDPLVPFSGGEVHFLWKKRGKVIPVARAAAFWAAEDGCGSVPVTQALPQRDPSDPTSVDRVAYPPSPRGDEVFLFIVHGGGHTWPQGLQYARPWLVGRVSRQLDACGVIWDFFKRHKR